MLAKRRPRIHFVGIGGIGMSGIARILLQQGVGVSGSDVSRNAIIDQLAAQGASIAVGHHGSHVDGADLVVYSSSIAPSNLELVAARNQGIPTRSRAQMLAACMRGKEGIAVSGAHGKTTTTGLTATLLDTAGLDPTVILGGEVERFGGNAQLGKGRHIVVEADESDGSLVYLTPTIAVITNVEEEHLDYYRNLDEILHVYQHFIRRIRPGGRLICCGDDPGVQRLLPGSSVPSFTYGLGAACALRADGVRVEGRRAEYVARCRGRRLGRVQLHIPGVHNVVNSLAAVGVGLALDLDFRVIAKALASYEGADRRFQVRGEVDGVMIVEDYAHHPTEIAATLQAARTWPGRRLFCVFQPHRFTRTKYLRQQFGRAFAAADHVIVTDIYAASEDPIDGVGAELLSQAVRASGFQAVQVLSWPAIVPHLVQTVRSGDIVLVLGAGDIGKVATELAQALQGRSVAA